MRHNLLTKGVLQAHSASQRKEGRNWGLGKREGGGNEAEGKEAGGRREGGRDDEGGMKAGMRLEARRQMRRREVTALARSFHFP